MNKRTVYMIVDLLLIIGSLFGEKLFCDEYLSVPISPSLTSRENSLTHPLTYLLIGDKSRMTI